MTTWNQFHCVQGRGGPTNDNANSNPDVFAGQVVSCDSVEQLHCHCRSTTTFRAFTPVGFRRLTGGFLPQGLDLKPALCHRSAETCAAPLRRVLRLGHARQTPLDTGAHRPTGKDNDRALNGSLLERRGHKKRRKSLRVVGHCKPCDAQTTVKIDLLAIQQAACSEPCGFLFLFFLWTGVLPNGSRLHRAVLLLLGGIALFLSFRFCFNSRAYQSSSVLVQSNPL